MRAEAAKCFRHLKSNELGEYIELVESFVDSKAFADHHRSLFYALKETTAKLPEITCAACEKFLEIASTAVSDMQTHAAGDSYQVAELIVRTYRQIQDKTIQARCLDLIDKLAQLRALGLSNAVAEFER